MGYITLFINSTCFLLPVNILVHDLLQGYFAAIVNAFTVFLTLVGIAMYCFVIHRNQIFKFNNRSFIRKIKGIIIEFNNKALIIFLLIILIYLYDFLLHHLM